MKARFVLAATISLLMLPMICPTVRAQGTAFTYQGRLATNGVEVDGSFDFQFGLYTNVSLGNPVGSLETNAATAVSNGVFTTTLNFSNAFNGTAYWLGIGVRSNGTTNAFTPLTPRQPITPAPYAITASNLTGTLPAAQLTGAIPAGAISGTFSNSVSFTNLTNIFAGNGSGLTNVPGVTQSNALYAYDTTSQLLSTAGSYQNITFTSASSTGWFIPASGEFVAGQTGTYLVQYQAHFFNSYPSANFAACIRAVLNLTSSPVEITSSEGVTYVPPNCVELASRSFLISMTAGQMLSLQMAGNIPNGTSGTSGGYLDSSTFYGQFFPSITLTIVRIQ